MTSHRAKNRIGAELLIFLALGFGAAIPGFARPFGRQSPVAASEKPAGKGLDQILDYISSGWGSLTRSLGECKTYADEKAVGKPLLYLPDGVAEPAAVKHLESECGVSVRHLPATSRKPDEKSASGIEPAGLLYLPHPYVVPGGRFNEMYGWDSYFILRGLLLDGKIRLARGIVENFFYEIQHYGMVLNANRSYYLTRSQPPFLSAMILAVYESEKTAGRDDLAWLREAYPYAVRDYDFWTRGAHLAGKTGLSRYYDFGSGPAPEVMAANPQYYRYVAAYFVRHPQAARGFLDWVPNDDAGMSAVGPLFDVSVCQQGPAMSNRDCDSAGRVRLSAKFYKGDRSLRESGFDVTFRFGPFGAGTPDFAPVGLNSLLYESARNLERMSRLLGRPQEAQKWARLAAERRENIRRYLWNAKRGLFFDYDFVTKRQSSYVFATTFYPLWTGLATAGQARAVAANAKLFLEPGGLVTSLRPSEAQWDYPYGWAPLELISAEGLRRYGYNEDADRISYRFLGTVLANFRRDGTIREKYNVVTRSSDVSVRAGYRQNVVGFGWTNGVFLALLKEMPESWRERLAGN
jgi:alpha,alpha-trehalase